jgi:hypothetical protein
VVPEPVRERVHADLAAAADNHLVDAGGGQRLPVAHAQPQLGPLGVGMPGAGAEVPVQAAGGLVADLDDPVLAALAVDDELPLPQVEITAAQADELGQPDAGRGEHGDDGGVAALGEAAARARPFQPRQLPGGEDRDQLVGDARRLHPGHRVGQLVFGGRPFEELLQGRYWLLA